MKLLLDYLFPITAIEPTSGASTAFLKQVCLVCKPKSGQEGNVGQIFACTTMTQVQARIANVDANQHAVDDAQELFNAGMSKVYILLSNDLDLADALTANPGLFYTVLVSSDFIDDDFASGGDAAESADVTVGDLTFTAPAGEDGNDLSIEFLNEVDDAGEEVVHVAGDVISVYMKDNASTAQQIKDACENSVEFAALGVTVSIAGGQENVAQQDASSAPFTGGSDATGTGLLLGTFAGVSGMASTDLTLLDAQAAISRRCAFFKKNSTGSKNLCYAFGKLLSNSLNWRNQQYIPMPFDDDVETVGDAESLFDERISFSITDDEFSNRLAFFACGGKAIVEPYIVKNLTLDIQSKALQYISGNQPAYTKTQAALLEDELQTVIDGYIEDQEIEAGEIEVSLENDNFVASGAINISEPKALWRVEGELRQTL